MNEGEALLALLSVTFRPASLSPAIAERRVAVRVKLAAGAVERHRAADQRALVRAGIDLRRHVGDVDRRVTRCAGETIGDGHAPD